MFIQDRQPVAAGGKHPPGSCPAASARSASLSQPLARDSAGPRRRSALPRGNDDWRHHAGPDPRPPAPPAGARGPLSAEPTCSRPAAAPALPHGAAGPTPGPPHIAPRRARPRREPSTRRSDGTGDRRWAASAQSRAASGCPAASAQLAGHQQQFSLLRGPSADPLHFTDRGVCLGQRIVGQPGRQQHGAAVDADGHHRHAKRPDARRSLIEQGQSAAGRSPDEKATKPRLSTV